MRTKLVRRQAVTVSKGAFDFEPLILSRCRIDRVKGTYTVHMYHLECLPRGG